MYIGEFFLGFGHAIGGQHLGAYPVALQVALQASPYFRLKGVALFGVRDSGTPEFQHGVNLADVVAQAFFKT